MWDGWVQWQWGDMSCRVEGTLAKWFFFWLLLSGGDKMMDVCYWFHGSAGGWAQLDEKSPVQLKAAEYAFRRRQKAFWAVSFIKKQKAGKYMAISLPPSVILSFFSPSCLPPSMPSFLLLPLPPFLFLSHGKCLSGRRWAVGYRCWLQHSPRLES